MDLHRSNNFDALRIVLALIVVGAHIADVTALSGFQVFRPFFDSDFAVKAFFVVSGFLVMRSFRSSRSLAEFAEKRIRRIYPAYLCAILLCLVIGACLTKLSLVDFLFSPATWKYLAANAVFLNFLQPTLPGVFESNPMPAMDGALWTLKVEVALYFCVPVIFWLFRRYRPLPVALAVSGLSIAWAYVFQNHFGSAELARQFPGQLAFFVLGSLLAMDGRIFGRVAYIALVSGIAFWALRGSLWELFVQPFFYASLTVFLATFGRVHVSTGPIGDVSYGIYLYHFPIIQALVAIGGFGNPWSGVADTLVLTMGAAYASWHLVERPLLRRSPERVPVSGFSGNA